MYSTSPTWGVTDSALARNRSLVLGGEACIWGEGTSEDSIETQTLTYASAVAERLWTGNNVTEADIRSRSSTVSERLAQFVCLMNRQGLRASPVSPGFCLRGPRKTDDETEAEAEGKKFHNNSKPGVHKWFEALFFEVESHLIVLLCFVLVLSMVCGPLLLGGGLKRSVSAGPKSS